MNMDVFDGYQYAGNGTQIIKRVKGSYPHVKILMLTNLHDKENINQAIVNGAD